MNIVCHLISLKLEFDEEDAGFIFHVNISDYICIQGDLFPIVAVCFKGTPKNIAYGLFEKDAEFTN